MGVGLVVAVTALSNGLDDAQDEVLRPLTGVGTDMSVTRPLRRTGSPGTGPFGGQGLSAEERRQLEREHGPRPLSLEDLGEPGERFERDEFVSATQLSFPASRAAKVASLPGAKDAAAGLTVTALHVEGTVPERSARPFGPGPQGAPGPPRDIDLSAMSVTGVDVAKPTLAAISPSQVTRGRYLRSGSAREVVLNTSYARRQGLSVGETVTLEKRRFRIVGLAKTPLGGQASDVYVKLDQLQRLSGREGRANVLYVRAKDAGSVDRLEQEVKRSFAGTQVTTSKDLADRVKGSLVDAKNLSNSLGTALAIVALVAAFLIASLLSLSSVTKRVRELGTLKAIGWRQRHVVRQVTGESLVQGLLGGLVGAALGVGGALLIDALAPTLEASVAQAAPAGPGPAHGPGPGGAAAIVFGQGQVSGGSTEVALSAPVDVGLIVLAVGLALLGGLLAGGAGGLRAARLRPAEALRHIG